MPQKLIVLIAPILMAALVVIALGQDAAATRRHMKAFQKKYPKIARKLLRCETCHLKKGQKLKSEKPAWMFEYKGNEKGELPPPPKKSSRTRRPSRTRPPSRTPASRSGSSASGKSGKNEKNEKKKLPASVKKLLENDAKTKKPHNFFGLQFFSLGGKKRPISQRLEASRTLDADGDGYPNEMELLTGHSPADPADKPTAAEIKKAGLRPPKKKKPATPRRR